MAQPLFKAIFCQANATRKKSVMFFSKFITAMSRNFNYNDSETLVVKMSKDKVQLIKTGNHFNGPDVIANACKLHLANNYSEAK